MFLPTRYQNTLVPLVHRYRFIHVLVPRVDISKFDNAGTLYDVVGVTLVEILLKIVTGFNNVLTDITKYCDVYEFRLF